MDTINDYLDQLDRMQSFPPDAGWPVGLTQPVSWPTPVGATISGITTDGYWFKSTSEREMRSFNERFELAYNDLAGAYMPSS